MLSSAELPPRFWPHQNRKWAGTKCFPLRWLQRPQPDDIAVQWRDGELLDEEKLRAIKEWYSGLAV